MYQVDETRIVRRRVIIWSLIGVGIVIVIGGIWLLVTALLVRGQLADVRAEVHQLRDEVSQGDLVQARVTLADLQTHAHRAHSLATGPAWAIAAAIPWVGDPVETVRGVASEVDKLAHATLPVLVQARAVLEPSSLRRPDGSIDLAPIVKVAPTLATADTELSAATKDVQHLPGHTWLAPVNSAHSDIVSQLLDIASTVHSADLGAHIVPPMLGIDGTKRYFVGFQNEAEARGTGGLPGAFGILQVTDGKATFVRFENDSYLSRLPTGLDFGSDFNQLYDGYDATSLYVNSDASPHFPYAAQVWTAMWQKKTGQHLDGAISIDPTALSYLLGATGPVTLADQTVISADNVVGFTESTVYARFPNSQRRKDYLSALARAVSTHIIDSHAATSGLVDAVGKAIGQRRITIWSADPPIEELLQKTAASGAVPETKAPYASAWLTNAGGNKLDYYMLPTMEWERTGCGATRSVTVTITVSNNAPVFGLPPYVTNRSDVHPKTVRPGDAHDFVSYAATQGAALDSVTLDGKPTTVSAGVERGHPVYVFDLEIPVGTTHTIVMHLSEPAGKGSLVLVPQPLVHPWQISTSDVQC